MQAKIRAQQGKLDEALTEAEALLLLPEIRHDAAGTGFGSGSGVAAGSGAGSSLSGTHRGVEGDFIDSISGGGGRLQPGGSGNSSGNSSGSGSGSLSGGGVSNTKWAFDALRLTDDDRVSKIGI